MILVQIILEHFCMCTLHFFFLVHQTRTSTVFYFFITLQKALRYEHVSKVKTTLEQEILLLVKTLTIHNVSSQ